MAKCLLISVMLAASVRAFRLAQPILAGGGLIRPCASYSVQQWAPSSSAVMHSSPEAPLRRRTRSRRRMRLAAAGDSVAEAEPAVVQELSEPEEEIDAGARNARACFELFIVY
jgi:hypothetical protein